MKRFISSAALWYFVINPGNLPVNGGGSITIREPDQTTCEEIVGNITTYNPTLPVSQCLPVPTSPPCTPGTPTCH